MRDFPSCFGESGVQIADASSSSSSAGKAAAQNVVTCLYQTRFSGRPCVISVTWCKSLMGQGLSVGVDDLSGHCLCKADIKPWLFSKKKGSKRLDVEDGKIEIFWDLSGAKFGAGPEPLEGFYVAVVFDLELVLLLGDMKKDAYRKTGANRPILNAAFVARREHIYGKKIYSAKAQFCDNGQFHDIVIECDTIGLKDPCLEIRVDKKPVMQVKRLAWKFRGNQTILVDGLPVEVFWDVHSWLFGSAASNAVFMFHTCQAPEKSMPWSYSQIFRESQLQDGIGRVTSSGMYQQTLPVPDYFISDGERKGIIRSNKLNPSQPQLMYPFQKIGKSHDGTQEFVETAEQFRGLLRWVE